jgi:hypothetical protein
LAGAGTGLVLGPASTDAVNRAPQTSYGEVTGITQTVRNFGASVGLALLGTILILENKSDLEDSLGALGIPKSTADQIADSLSNGGSGAPHVTGESAHKVFEQVQISFASASRTVFYGMAVAMLIAFLIALVALPAGRVTEVIEAPDEAAA